MILINLQVLTGKMAGDPRPTCVCAFISSTYTVSGDNPSMVPVILFDLPPDSSPKPSISIPPQLIEYCVIFPLGYLGGIHCKVKEVEVTVTISNDCGSLGATYKEIW